ncbi:translation initiation factor IF-2-like [Mauremys mutica]|uniref:translation initiation factor IF-2-like n=1 Tax=Mauremys mutica TaxID=74926 RepID=UPI001D16EE41|nr:translation initiation factor IF-2-like [Mauremys mutica]
MGAGLSGPQARHKPPADLPRVFHSSSTEHHHPPRRCLSPPGLACAQGPCWGGDVLPGLQRGSLRARAAVGGSCCQPPGAPARPGMHLCPPTGDGAAGPLPLVALLGGPWQSLGCGFWSVTGRGLGVRGRALNRWVRPPARCSRNQAQRPGAQLAPRAEQGPRPTRWGETPARPPALCPMGRTSRPLPCSPFGLVLQASAQRVPGERPGQHRRAVPQAGQCQTLPCVIPPGAVRGGWVKGWALLVIKTSSSSGSCVCGKALGLQGGLGARDRGIPLAGGGGGHLSPCCPLALQPGPIRAREGGAWALGEG